LTQAARQLYVVRIVRIAQQAHRQRFLLPKHHVAGSNPASRSTSLSDDERFGFGRH
jgi:hypothetical protein